MCAFSKFGRRSIIGCLLLFVAACSGPHKKSSARQSGGDAFAETADCQIDDGTIRLDTNQACLLTTDYIRSTGYSFDVLYDQQALEVESRYVEDQACAGQTGCSATMHVRIAGLKSGSSELQIKQTPPGKEVDPQDIRLETYVVRVGSDQV